MNRQAIFMRRQLEKPAKNQMGKSKWISSTNLKRENSYLTWMTMGKHVWEGKILKFPRCSGGVEKCSASLRHFLCAIVKNVFCFRFARNIFQLASDSASEPIKFKTAILHVCWCETSNNKQRRLRCNLVTANWLLRIATPKTDKSLFVFLRFASCFFSGLGDQ